ncbi:MAG: Gfo/Idh/MocA family oxidoreductase [Anaerolineae bacterium]
MPTIKLGIVGAGFVANFHTRAIKQVRTMEIAGITALKGAEALSATVQKHGLGAGTVYPNVAEMAKHVDAIAVYVPNFARVETVEQIVDAVKAGATLKGVICE